MTLPAADELQERYPEFCDVRIGLIDATIADAAGWVSAPWREADRVPAILALAAHMLASDGHGTGGGSAVSGPVASVKVGDVQTNFAGAAAAGGGGGLDGFAATSYGRRFLALRRRNFPGVAVA